MRRVSSSVALLALACAAVPTAAQRPVPVVRDVPVEHPEALRHFHDALRERRAGAPRHVRVAHWGDSNVAADLWTAVARRRLQAAFGNGGAGYLVPPPFGSRHDGPVELRAGPGWQGRRLGFVRDFGPSDGLWGLAGVAVEGGGRAALRVRIPSLPGGGVLEVHALGHARGGAFELRVDDGPATRIDTRRDGPSLVRHAVGLSPGTHRAELRVATARPVRVLGVVVERAAPGVVYDVLGINGHRVSAHLEWHEGLLEAQLDARPPDLVVLSYGGNEALDVHLAMSRYEQHLAGALERVRDLAPDASCLVVAPVAMCPENPRRARVTEIQRRLAPRYGCAFWDTGEVSGGPGSLCAWIRAGDGLVSGDGMHLGRRGYELVGQRFTDALLRDL